MNDSSRSIKACAQYYGENAAAVEAYLLEGEKRALELGNRGPILFDDQGKLAREIRNSYSKNGFYIPSGLGLKNNEIKKVIISIKKILN